MGIRFASLILPVIAAYSYLLFHLYDLQLARGEHYLTQAQAQESAGILQVARRGAIYFTDKDGVRLTAATNRDFPHVYASPKAILEPVKTAEAAAGILGMPGEKLISIFSKKDSDYALLVKRADPNVALKISELKIKGLYAQSLPERFYPSSAAAQLIGFVGPNENDFGVSGRYGIEEEYDRILAGKNGSIGRDKMDFAEHGKDLYLTVDSNIQKESERIVGNLVKKYGGKDGTIIVADPKTGKILAMSSFPSFDPNFYGDSPVSNFQNPAIEQIYEPGSVFKVITAAAALDAGKITPEETYLDAGSLILNGKTIKNWDLKAHGRVSMTGVLEMSLNTGAVYIQRKLGNAAFTEYVRKFGFGGKTGIRLPGELNGNIRELNPKAPAIAFATASFGQGVAVTPLQLLSAVAAIANGGELMRPYLTVNDEPKTVRRAISKEVADTVTKMMISAVDKAGVAKINGYSIAGKTGTAQVADLVRGGYSEKYVNTYVGFGPTSNPQFIILVKLSESQDAPLAGVTVVPAFRELAQYIINYYNIPPDRL